MKQCEAVGCTHTTKNHPSTFFTIPKGKGKRARMWYENIKIKSTHRSNKFLCGDHFDARCFTSTFCSRLLRCAVPTFQNANSKPSSLHHCLDGIPDKRALRETSDQLPEEPEIVDENEDREVSFCEDNDFDQSDSQDIVGEIHLNHPTPHIVIAEKDQQAPHDVMKGIDLIQSALRDVIKVKDFNQSVPGDVMKGIDLNLNKSALCETHSTYKDLYYQLNGIKVRCSALESKVSSLSMSEATFKNDEEKVNFYTGLTSFPVLMSVFNLILPFANSTFKNTLTPFQELIMLLMRLRLNLATQDLAYRFNVSQRCASNVFTKWLNAAFMGMKNKVIWPDRETFEHSMPTSFKQAFGSKVAIIIDCLEVVIDKPTADSSTCANYDHNTVKFVIGITPCGLITFISKSWGGMVSDEYIIEHCGILDHLLPGDKILVDRGFEVCDSVGFHCAELCPSSSESENQLVPFEIHDDHTVASVRVRLKKVIFSLKRSFHILRWELPMDFLTVKDGEIFSPLNKIVVVCSALSNLSPLIPLE